MSQKGMIVYSPKQILRNIIRQKTKSIFKHYQIYTLYDQEHAYVPNLDLLIS
jgi:hypothetical protein